MGVKSNTGRVPVVLKAVDAEAGAAGLTNWKSLKGAPVSVAVGCANLVKSRLVKSEVFCAAERTLDGAGGVVVDEKLNVEVEIALFPDPVFSFGGLEV